MSVVVVKKPSIFREGLIRILTHAFPQNTIRGVDPTDLTAIKNYYVDICLIDIDDQPKMVENIQKYIGYYNDIIIWTENEQHPELPTLFSSNMLGYFHSEMTQEELIDAMQQIFDGGTFIHPKFSSHLLHCYREKNKKTPKRPYGLFTRREWEVMALLIDGYNNQQISKELYITEKTVKNHISSILKKLSVPDRTNAVLKALKNEWFYLT